MKKTKIKILTKLKDGEKDSFQLVQSLKMKEMVKEGLVISEKKREENFLQNFQQSKGFPFAKNNFFQSKNFGRKKRNPFINSPGKSFSAFKRISIDENSFGRRRRILSKSRKERNS